MAIGESVRLGVLRKVIKGNFERKKFRLRYLSFKICLSVFRIIATFFIYQRIFKNVDCSLAAALLNSNPLEFLKYLYPFSSYVKNKFLNFFS